MSNPPYPSSNSEPPFASFDDGSPDGQQPFGGSTYRPSAPVGDALYPTAPNFAPPYSQQQGYPYRMNSYPEYHQHHSKLPTSTPYPPQPEHANTYASRLPCPNTPLNTPYPSSGFSGVHGAQLASSTLNTPYPSSGFSGVHGAQLASSTPYPPVGSSQYTAGLANNGGIGMTAYPSQLNPGGRQGFLWSQDDKHQFLDVDRSGKEICYSGRFHQVVDEQTLGPIVRADRPIPRHGQFYFEVVIVNKGQNREIAVGICNRNSPLDRFPGWVPFSFGYHGDDGNIFCESDKSPKYKTYKTFNTGDLIGVQLDFTKGTLTFKRRGKEHLKEIQQVSLSKNHMEQEYYPCVGISSPGAIVRLNTPVGHNLSATPQQGHKPQNQPNLQMDQLNHQPGYQGNYQQHQMRSLTDNQGGMLSNCEGNKKALLIGINYYGQNGQLSGCINDVNNIKNLVKTRGFMEDSAHMRILTDNQRDVSMQPTRRNIIEAMHWLVKGAQPNDSLFLHYSGHGSQKADTDGDEVDGYDETIVPVDAKTAGQIVDDEMNAILVKQLPRRARLTAIFDSCHSATALDLPFIYDCNGNIKPQKASRKNLIESGIESLVNLKTGNPIGAIMSGRKALTSIMAIGNEENAQEITEKTRSSQGDVIMFAGCKDCQTSADTTVKGYGATGAASYAFIDAVSKRRNITYIELLAVMRETLRNKYSQVVQMSTGFPTNMNTAFFF